MSDVPSNLIPTRLTQLAVAPYPPSEDSLMWIVYQGNNYQVRVGDLLSVVGVPTTRQVLAGTGMAGGGPLSSNVTLNIAPGGVGNSELDTTGVASGTYGDATHIPVFIVDTHGRVTAATQVPVTLSGYVPTTTKVIAGTGLTGGGALGGDVTLTAELSSTLPIHGDNTGVIGVSNTMARADHQHPSVDISDTNEVTGILGIAQGGTSKAISIENGGIVWCGSDGLYVGTAGVAGQVLVSGGAGEYAWGDIELESDVPANTVHSGPVSGPDALPSFRALVNADLPASGVSANTYGSGTLVPVLTINAKGVVTAVTTSAVSASSVPNSVTFTSTGGAAPGATFDGSAAKTVDYSTLGAQPAGAYLTGVTASTPLSGAGTSGSHLVHATTDGNKHVPATSTTNNGKVLTAGASAGNLSWTTPTTGTVTSVATSAPLSGGPITGSGTVSITQAGVATDGYLSSTDWGIFNGKQPAGSYIPYTGASNDIDFNAKAVKNFFISKAADTTAKFTFDVSGLSTGTSRTLTVPNSSGTLLTTAAAVTIAQGGTGATTAVDALTALGGVTGPASNTADYLPQWNGANSKTLKDGLAVPAGGLAGITDLNLKAPIASPTFTGVPTLPAMNFGFQSIATDGGAVAFTVATPYYTIFTGTQGETVTMPNATTLAVGRKFMIDNDSTQAITVNASGGGALWIIAPSCDLYLTCTGIGSAAGTWEKDYYGAKAASGKSLTISNTLTLAGTDSTTMTFPTTSATLARTDAAQTFTGHNTFEGVTSTGATGTGKMVFDGTPTLVTPVLGAATATSLAVSGFVGTSATGALQLPVGTTAQQPTPASGMIRMNSSTGRPEWYSTAYAMWIPFSTAMAMPNVGDPIGGGFFAGFVSVAGNGIASHYLIVSPKATGETAVAWDSTAGGSTTGFTSVIDGPTNSAGLAALGARYAAATWCEGLTINGYSDWYFPAKNELEVAYYFLKNVSQANYQSGSIGSNANAVPPMEPVSTAYSATVPAQTTAAAFRVGAAEAFENDAFFWSSTENSAIYATIQCFNTVSPGKQASVAKTDGYYVRAFRRRAL